MPLQNFSASALQSFRTRSAFSARACISFRHAGESSASWLFMHFASLPCPARTSPQNFFASAAQGPSAFFPCAPALAAANASDNVTAIETSTFLIDMFPPRLLFSRD